jgi:hypothetical protein
VALASLVAGVTLLWQRSPAAPAQEPTASPVEPGGPAALRADALPDDSSEVNVLEKDASMRPLPSRGLRGELRAVAVLYVATAVLPWLVGTIFAS